MGRRSDRILVITRTSFKLPVILALALPQQISTEDQRVAGLLGVYLSPLVAGRALSCTKDAGTQG